MGSGIVTVGRKQYASGLYWENSPTGRVSQAAKEASRQPGSQSEFFVVRAGNKQGRVPQFGLAPSSGGFRAGLPSLAGCLANQQPGSWIGAFRLREGVAMVVVRDDLIVPDGDAFFLDETEARDRLFQELAVGGFQRVYAPESWGVPSADTMPLTLLLNERSDIRLRSVTLTVQGKIAIAAGLSVVLLLLGFGWYVQEQRAAEEREVMERLAAMERLKQQAMRMAPISQQPVYPEPEKKWEKRPYAMALISACQEALQKIDVGVAGWKMVGMRCGEGGLQASWMRSGGFSNPPPGAVVSDSAGDAVLSVPLTALEPRGEEALLNPDVVTKRYLNQNWPGSINRIPDDPPPPPPPDYKGEWNPPPPPWIKRSFTVTVPVLPWTLPTFLDDFPGLIVNSLSLNGTGYGSNETWTVEGVIYENRRR